jgi:histidinol-phosphate aminotransferase
MIRPRKAVERLKKYRPPQEGRGGKMRLDFNENTVGCPPEVVRALRRALNPEMLTRYPEYDESRGILSRYFGVDPAQMLLANGTDDAIKMICDSFVDPDDTLLLPAPTFPVYEFFHNVAGGQVMRVRYDQNFHLPVEELLAALKKGVRWMAIANPNNPTGTVIAQPDLKTLLEAAPNTLILVDEAYYDFSGETVLPWIGKYPNLVVTRTFSKAFGLAALRLGCVFAHQEVAEALHRAQNPFAVNSLALLGAQFAIQHEDYVRKLAEDVRTNRSKFCEWLDHMGIPYVPSRANFVLTRVGERAPEIAQCLRDKKILVRDWSYDPHLKGYLRFTIGSTAQLRSLVKELESLQPLIELRQSPKPWRNMASFDQTGWFA